MIDFILLFMSFLQKALEDHNKKSSEELKSLFKFAQGAAHVWDVHEIGLARQERALQEKLEQSRQVHDNQNQVLSCHPRVTMASCFVYKVIKT